MRPTIYTINRPGLGTISTMARPRGDRWLRREMREDSGRSASTSFVCAMEPAERDECGLSDEASAALASGIGRSSLLAAAVLVEGRRGPGRGVGPDLRRPRLPRAGHRGATHLAHRLT